MSLLRLTVASLVYHWRTNLAVACGVAVGTAVLCGALLVGDSMRGSLRRLTLDRLGRIDDALVANHFFRAALADELGSETAPVILLQASVQKSESRSGGRTARVSLIGCDDRFWRLGDGRPQRLPGAHEIVLNRPAADRLGVGVGDALLLHLPRMDAAPGESLFGRKKETTRAERVVVTEIVAAEGLGTFSLWPMQWPPLNAYVSLDWLERQLDRQGRVNAILAANGNHGQLVSGHSAVRPQLADYGLRVERAPRGYWNITSDRMMLTPTAEQEILKCLNGVSESVVVQPAMTYLANTLAYKDREVPYSTVTAIDFTDHQPLGPFRSADGKPLPPLGPNEIALNSWAAEQLHARVGDPMRLVFFKPESLDGQVQEQSVDLRLAAVVEFKGAADDRNLTPSVKGVTDERTMADWDPPFPFDARRIRPADEEYWNRYRATPKAFVSLATGRRLWGSRFGQTTSIRVADKIADKGDGGRRQKSSERTGTSSPPTSVPVDASRLLQRQLDPAAMGFAFQPIKQQQLAASAGSTPFGVLFLCFSFFIIAAAVMLVALLFRLAVERRASQIGTLLALGLSRRQVVRAMLGEGFVVAAVGAVLGVPSGIGYAALMLLGLQTWWLPAISTPFLRLHVGLMSPAIGCVGGLVVSLAAIWISVRRIARVPPRRLLAGMTSTVSPLPLGKAQGVRAARAEARPLPRSQRNTRRWRITLVDLLLLLAFAPAIAILKHRSSLEGQPGVFFATGAVTLAALLGVVWLSLRAGMTGSTVAVGGGNLARMALRNAARNPGRSTLTVGLVAAASFIIVSVSVFRVDPTQQKPSLFNGSGGYSLIGESDQPILQDLNSPGGRAALGFSPQDEKLLARTAIVGLRASAGDDASCLNLYRPRQPRVLGIPRQFVRCDGFAWAAKPADCANPWELLDVASQATTTDEPIPVILEKNTANYSLQLWGGLGETFEISDGRNRRVKLRVVALLADSVFQGDLLVSESAFVRLFPDADGHRVFLVRIAAGWPARGMAKTVGKSAGERRQFLRQSSPSPLPERIAAVQMALEDGLGEYGFSAGTTGQRLAELLAVQNTYLSTFQSLGGLGLLLGTLGLATVQLRNVLERRGELALLRATGFRRRTLASLVLLEHTSLLLAGLAVGTVAAAIAVLPHVLNRGAGVPWTALAYTLAAVLVVGLAAGLLAVRAVLRAPLLAALREEPT
jgi:putative ABC transport system permease protein